MEGYNVSLLMKKTKEVLCQKNVDIAAHKKLMKMLRQPYAERTKLVPEGFKPNMENQHKKQSNHDQQ
jgi:hypothetical protein